MYTKLRKISFIVEVDEDIDDSTLLDDAQEVGFRLAAEHDGLLDEDSVCVESAEGGEQ